VRSIMRPILASMKSDNSAHYRRLIGKLLSGYFLLTAVCLRQNRLPI